MPLILPGSAPAPDPGYQIDNSCRFEAGDSASMTKNFSTPTIQDKWTVSFWVKRCKLGATQHIFGGVTDANNYGQIRFGSDDTLTWWQFDGDDYKQGHRLPTQLFRDPAAWYHIVCVWDSGNATAGDRMKMYVNGTQVTTFTATVDPPQNTDGHFNSAVDHYIGTKGTGVAAPLSAYLAEFVFCDGQTYAASDFGEFDSRSPTIWKPKDVSELTFGTNGFYLDFEDSANLGNDANGGTDWTESNLDAADQSQDSPTNNFCTLNPLNNSSYETLANGNNTASGTAADNGSVMSTLNPNGGKWYVETKCTPGSGSYDDYYPKVGITQINTANYGRLLNAAGGQAGRYPGTFYVMPDGTLVVDASDNASWMTAFTSGGNIGIAVDCDNGAAYVALNNSWQNSGDPTSGASKTGAAVTWTPADSDGIAFGSSDYSSSSSEWNFGNGCFGNTVVTSAEADGNGYGLFEYAPPSGYLALCTKNLGSDGG